MAHLQIGVIRSGGFPHPGSGGTGTYVYCESACSVGFSAAGLCYSLLLSARLQFAQFLTKITPGGLPCAARFVALLIQRLSIHV